MTAKIIDGKQIALELREDIAKRVAELKKSKKVVPGLAVILVGQDPASTVYVNNKKKAAAKAGMNSYEFKMSGNVCESDLITKIDELNKDEKVHGILVQLPLPKHINTNKVIHTINPDKDVDGFHVYNAGKLAVGEITGPNRAMVPCTPMGCLYLLKKTIGTDLKGKKALVIGSSNIVGKPMARLLGAEKCTVTVANSATKDLKAECLQADILVSATGVHNLITKDMVKKGATVIDVGINRVDLGEGGYRLEGDVDYKNVKEVAGAITPVPGGVGPMTIAYLLKNTLDCCIKLNQ